MIISIIVAIGNNRIIGNKNALPWNLPADMDHFRQMTKDKPVIMGQKTFESIGKPLPERINIVLTRDKSFNPSGCTVVFSIEEALKAVEKFNEVMIIGGASVYGQFLPLANKMYLTLVEGDFEGDTFFPEFEWSDWKETERKENLPDKNNPYKYTFLTLEKI